MQRLRDECLQVNISHLSKILNKLKKDLPKLQKSFPRARGGDNSNEEKREWSNGNKILKTLNEHLKLFRKEVDSSVSFLYIL